MIHLHFAEAYFEMASFRRNGKSERMTLLAVSAFVMCTGMLLYLSLLLSPALFRGIVKDVCDNNRQMYVQGKHSASNSTLKDVHSRSVKSLSILIGVFMTAAKAERRNLLRLAYGVQYSEIADVTVKFVVGKLKSTEEKVMLGMEILHHKDVIVLECEENLNQGKTFSFFSTLAAQGSKYDYVMKTDDDSYLRLENLAQSLYLLPRTDLYYGYILPCENSDAYSWYMAGMGYVLSWDLVQWIWESPIPRGNRVGTEDQLIADWFNQGKKAKNRVSKKPLFYDHPDFGGHCSHGLIPDTILIHQLKTRERWIQVLSYFEEQRMEAMFPSSNQPPA